MTSRSLIATSLALVAVGCSGSKAGSSSGGTAASSSTTTVGSTTSSGSTTSGASTTSTSTSSSSGSASAASTSSSSSAAAASASSGSSSSSSSSSGSSASSSGGSGSSASSSSGSGSSAASSSGSGSSGSGGGSCPGGGLPSDPCTPTDASCHATTDACLAAVENAGASAFTLRMAYVQPTKPDAFTVGIAANVFDGSVLPNNITCNLNGAGDTNFLLKFDLGASTLELGSSKPVSSPAGPFTFETDDVAGLGGASFAVAPAVLDTSSDGGCGFGTTSADVVLPVYLDNTGSSEFVLPIRSASVSGVVSTDQSCIGTYNAGGLDASQSCVPDSSHPAFLPGGVLNGFINLEDADSVSVAPLGESLCVMLSQNATIYGNGGTPNRCKRDSASRILFQGDWCSLTNAPADASCADSVQVLIPFAASGVTAN